jgi:anion-transporting  ArsA/GET3 family ATPase
MTKEKNVFTSLEAFEKRFPNLPENKERKEAMNAYFKYKGIIRAYESDKAWPKLTYPNYFVLEKKTKELKEKKDLFEKNLNSWKKRFKQAKNYHKNNQVKKIKDPLYWKHKAKILTDKDYRKDVETVNLPVHLVGDAKWKPMIKMFVNDLEYRKQLTETVRESIIYKKNKKVAQYADDLKDFRMGTSNKQIEILEKKIEKAKELETALKELMKWIKE